MSFYSESSGGVPGVFSSRNNLRGHKSYSPHRRLALAEGREGHGELEGNIADRVAMI